MGEERNMNVQTESVTVAFVIYYDEERYLEECIYYIKKLQIPFGVKAEIHKIKGKTDIQECYREAEVGCNAEYKVFLDQHVLIVYDLFLYEMLSEYERRLHRAAEHTSLPEEPDIKEVEDFVMSVHERVVKDEL